jgi:3-phosphoshikimate 1-carboxyvinyltransferase
MALLGALAGGTSRARNFLAGEDCLSTLACLSGLGIESRIDETGPGVATVEIDGKGLSGLREAEDVLDAGNSGTTMRLLAGVLAGPPFLSVITGDESLRARPMDRVIAPLLEMGAHLMGRDGDRLPPLVIRGGRLRGMEYKLPVASAQVKSAVLLAGLYADGETTIEEPEMTRDHTERMLRAMGVDVRREGPAVRLAPAGKLETLDIDIPGDFSAAAFWLVAAAAHPDAEVVLPRVGLNPTRSGLLDALRAMGAEVDIGEERMAGEEPVADIAVRSSRLDAIDVSGELALRMMDELPAFAVAACAAEGRSVVRDAQELRVKETDRIATLVGELRKLGAEIVERPDGFEIEGRFPLRGAAVSGFGDHRLAMALAVAGVMADGETRVADGESVAVSYPGFWQDLERLAGC